MTLFDRAGTVLAVLGITSDGRARAREIAARWSAALTRDPRLAKDVLHLSGVLRIEPRIMTGGEPDLAPIDPYRLAYERGQRDFARTLLAFGGMTIDEINQLVMEDRYDE
ncbi:hypothetical protein [Marinovum algicola]|uniref:hypothetical protein n=1 Tax=Marinovum algicola TaxID=42444 RepID=UPI003B525278